MQYDLSPQQPAPPILEGDRRFIGLRMNVPRQYLAEGYYSRAENKRVGFGLETRLGTRTPVFANLDIPGTYRGSGTYFKPAGIELGLIAVDTGVASFVYGIRSGTVPIQISVQTRFSGTVEFSQHFDKVLLHSSNPDQATMIWDGVNTVDGFVEITNPVPALAQFGYLAIPNPPWSISYDGRAVFPIPGSPDLIGFSDRGNPTLYDSIRHIFQINTGTADAIVGVYQYLRSNLIVCKEHSLNLIADIPRDLGDSFIDSLFNGFSPNTAPPPSVTSISDSIGIVARKAVITVAGRFMFLSDVGDGGIYQIATDQHGNYVVDNTPVSAAIEPLMKRINWTYAWKAIASSDGEYVYWSVPIDSSSFCNANLVWKIETGEWESLDLWNVEARDFGGGTIVTTDNPMGIDNIIRLSYYGAARLFAVNNIRARVHLLYKGTDDQMEMATATGEAQTYPIQDVMETRGYAQAGSDGRTERKSTDLNIDFATLEPTLEIFQIIEGSNGAEYPLLAAPLVYDRSVYSELYGKTPYLLNNQNSDAELPKRDDYAVHAGDELLFQEDGVRMQRIWPWTKNLSLDAVARYTSFRISNRTGICRVLGLIFESETTQSTREVAL